MELKEVRNLQAKDSDKSTYAGINLEIGNHPLTQDAMDKIQINLDNGNLNSSMWNPEVGIRIAKYQPDIIAVDGFPAFGGFGNKFLWMSLPNRPLKINPKGEVYVLQADATVGLIGNQYGIGNQLTLKERTDIENDSDNQVDLVSSAMKINLIIPMAIGTIVALLSVLGNIDKPTNRRNFLKNSLLGLSALTYADTFGQLIFPKLAAVTTSSELENFIQKALSVLGPRFNEYTWVKGRTALVIEKTMDCIDVLNLPKSTAASIVFGTGHGFDSYNLMKDPNARKEAIHDFIEYMLADIDKIFSLVHKDNLKIDAKRYFLAMITFASIVKVTDPGGSDIQPNFKDQLDQYITLNRSFKCPRLKEVVDSFSL